MNLLLHNHEGCLFPVDYLGKHPSYKLSKTLEKHAK